MKTVRLPNINNKLLAELLRTAWAEREHTISLFAKAEPNGSLAQRATVAIRAASNNCIDLRNEALARLGLSHTRGMETLILCGLLLRAPDYVRIKA